MEFNHDSLVCYVRKVNPRMELHGEDDVTAVDVSLRLMENDAGTAWDEVLTDLMGGVEDAGGKAQALGQMLEKLVFAASFEECQVNFRVSNETLARLSHAKVNKFVMAFDEDAGIVFRVQANADGATIGRLSELMKQRIRVEIVSHQPELDLDDDETEDAQDA